jgi:hypothetical protein
MSDKVYYKAHLAKGTTPFGYVLADTFEELKDGFWINCYFKYTDQPNDQEHWIPPGKIDFIEKKRDGDDREYWISSENG